MGSLLINKLSVNGMLLLPSPVSRGHGVDTGDWLTKAMSQHAKTPFSMGRGHQSYTQRESTEESGPDGTRWSRNPVGVFVVWWLRTRVDRASWVCTPGVRNSPLARTGLYYTDSLFRGVPMRGLAICVKRGGISCVWVYRCMPSISPGNRQYLAYWVSKGAQRQGLRSLSSSEQICFWSLGKERLLCSNPAYQICPNMPCFEY